MTLSTRRDRCENGNDNSKLRSAPQSITKHICAVSHCNRNAREHANSTQASHIHTSQNIRVYAAPLHTHLASVDTLRLHVHTHTHTYTLQHTYTHTRTYTMTLHPPLSHTSDHIIHSLPDRVFLTPPIHPSGSSSPSPPRSDHCLLRPS